MKADETKEYGMYDGRVMTSEDYMRQPGVADFERKFKKLAMNSANILTDKSDIETGKLHRVFNDGFPFGVNRRCIWIERSVLPLNPLIKSIYWRIAEGGKVGGVTGECGYCNQDYIKTASNQVYCEDCRDIKEKERKRAYYHRSK